MLFSFLTGTSVAQFTLRTDHMAEQDPDVQPLGVQQNASAIMPPVAVNWIEQS